MQSRGAVVRQRRTVGDADGNGAAAYQERSGQGDHAVHDILEARCPPSCSSRRRAAQRMRRGGIVAMPVAIHGGLGRSGSDLAVER